MTVSLAYIRVDVFDDSCNALAESMAVRNIAVLLIELCIGLEHVVHPLCRRCYQVDGLLAEQYQYSSSCIYVPVRHCVSS